MIIKRKTIIPISDINFYGNELEYVKDAVLSTWISSTGPYLDKFEVEFASKMDCSFAVSVNNGTSALLLALKALDIGLGDEVILPSLTFAATINAVIYAGATPVLIDSLPDHWNLDPDEIEKAITPATKVIIPVHLYGHPVEMQEILRIAKKYGLKIIEDAAEAQDATCMKKNVGALGDIGCFSFYANKIITTGEGGMCVTDDSKLEKRLRVLRDHGMNRDRRYWHEEIGFNFRMTNLNAAIGLAQLEQVDKFHEKRMKYAGIYDLKFADIPGVKPPIKSPFGKAVYWMYCLFLDDISSPISRDKLILELKEYNVDARPTFYPIHMMPPYLGVRRGSSLNNSELFGLNGINLPLYPALSEEKVNYIAEAVVEILEKAN